MAANTQPHYIKDRNGRFAGSRPGPQDSTASLARSAALDDDEPISPDTCRACARVLVGSQHGWNEFCGCCTADIETLRAFGRRLGSAEQWVEHSFAPEDAIGWIDNGFDVEQATTWRRHGFAFGEDAGPWKAAGFTPADAADACGYSNIICDHETVAF